MSAAKEPDDGSSRSTDDDSSDPWNEDAALQLDVALPTALRALHDAVCAGQTLRAGEALRQLAEAGENPRTLLARGDRRGRTLLHVLAALPPRDAQVVAGRNATAILLVEACARLGDETLLSETPLLLAVRAAVEVMDQAHELKVDSNTRLGTVSALLAMRADPNMGDVMDETPLMEAACAGDLEVCRVLLEFGADVHVVNRTGLVASDFTRNPAVAELLDGTPSVNHLDVALQQLQAAIEAGHGPGPVDDLLALSAGAAVQDVKSCLLVRLCQSSCYQDGAVGTVRWLLGARACPDAASDRGETALALAVRAAANARGTAAGGAEEALATVRALLEARADPGVGDDREETPLMEAANCGHEELCLMLLDAGARGCVLEGWQI